MYSYCWENNIINFLKANDDDDQLYQRKPKLNLKLDRATEVKQNVITMDLNRKEANIKFNVTTPVPQGYFLISLWKKFSHIK